MKTDFDIARSIQILPPVFRSEFNNATITANQAWSLFFTAGQDDAAIGTNPQLGQFFNRVLLSIVLAVALSSFVFRAF